MVRQCKKLISRQDDVSNPNSKIRRAVKHTLILVLKRCVVDEVIAISADVFDQQSGRHDLFRAPLSSIVPIVEQ